MNHKEAIQAMLNGKKLRNLNNDQIVSYDPDCEIFWNETDSVGLHVNSLADGDWEIIEPRLRAIDIIDEDKEKLKEAVEYIVQHVWVRMRAAGISLTVVLDDTELEVSVHIKPEEYRCE